MDSLNPWLAARLYDPEMGVRTLFIDTSLDTHIAVSLSGTDTVADTKRKLMYEHILRYPHLGPIVICAVKAEEREGRLFDLTDDMMVAPAFVGVYYRWLLYVDISRDGHVVGKEDQISDDKTEILCLAADLVFPDASSSTGNSLN